jgi:hypothetical protein
MLSKIKAWYIRIKQNRHIKLTYKLDKEASVATVYVNKKEAYWTPSDKQQIDLLVSHFEELKNAVLVED